jgi:glycosyltransferase involved in cell wall biosynthesis
VLAEFLIVLGFLAKGTEIIDEKFENISLKQGLSQSGVQCIIQDKQGFLWFGTQDGLNKYDGYGLYILESNSASIPVVQPSTGAFPEIVEMTGGGIIYSPDTVEELTASLLRLLNDNKLRTDLGSAGNRNVRSLLTLDKMAEGLSFVYKELIKNT